ncbi:MAG: site-specific DNA-methyltransferase [Desulfurivibrio sp.]|nr:site-specific DNA-methyltransferase [Desulfurivibrio sp.]MBU3914048.1 site-specific DNA-methyltransferase [bacterium]MBU4117619.1 site-specific DNA-methyltransferase [Pseudomonadota bacterium]
MFNKIYNNDARDILNFIHDKSITSTITSPPYFDMKDYESVNQIGFGQSYDEYINDLKVVFENIYKITKDDGTLWIIIDTFKKNGQVIPLPFDLVSKLVEIGWLLQDIIIWKKDKTVPWSGNGFVQRKFEYILFLSKSKSFKYHKDRVRIYDTSHLKKWWVKYPERYNPKGKALDEIWEYPIPTQGSWGEKYIRHFCPLPTDMVGTMIQLSTDEGDVVIDPFAGSGSVLSQASYMRRKYIGFELNISYIEMFEKYLESTLESGIRKYKLFVSGKDQNNFEHTILNLRAMKFAKIIIKTIKDILSINDFVVHVEIVGKSSVQYKLIKVKYIFIGNVNESQLAIILKETIAIPPLSKFGIEPIFEYQSFPPQNIINTNNFYGYTETNTYCTFSEVEYENLHPKAKIISSIKIELNENDYE